MSSTVNDGRYLRVYLVLCTNKHYFLEQLIRAFICSLFSYPPPFPTCSPTFLHCFLADLNVSDINAGLELPTAVPIEN